MSARDRLIDVLERALPPYLFDLSGYGHVADAILAEFPMHDDDDDVVCVNAHDRCYGGAGGPCPYCERTRDEPATSGENISKNPEPQSETNPLESR